MVEKIFVNASVSMQRSEYFVNKLPKVQTFEQASIIRMIGTDLQDIEILNRVSGGDVIAINAECLTRLRNRCRSFQIK